MPPPPFRDLDWSLSNAAGSSCSGSVSGARRRREQALLAAGGFVLVNGFDAWIGHPKGPSALTSQHYAPGVVYPDEARRIEAFTEKPWPTWRFAVEGGAHVVQEIQLVPGHAVVAARWSLAEDAPGYAIHVRPFLSGRQPAALHRKNGKLRAMSEKRGWKVAWRTYEGVPEVTAYCGGAFDVEPHWYDNFVYDDGATEDLWAPGVFHGPLKYGAPFETIFAAGWNEVVEGMILPEHPVLWAGEEPREKGAGGKREKPKTPAREKRSGSKKA